MKYSEEYVETLSLIKHIEIYKKQGLAIQLAKKKKKLPPVDKNGEELKGLVNVVSMNGTLIKKVFNFDLIQSKENEQVKVLVIDQIEIVPHLYIHFKKNNINANVTYIQHEKERQSSTQDEKGVINQFGFNYIHIKNQKELEKLDMKKEFDVILANPPYDGLAMLHQRFFNKAFEMLKDDGVMTFLQPSSPYITGFDDSTKQRPEDRKMRENVVKNTSSVTLLPPTIFDHAKLFYPLAVTVIRKGFSGFNGVDEFTDLSGKTYKNVMLNDLNVFEAKPTTHRVMVDKLKEWVATDGELNNSIFCRKADWGVVGENQYVVKMSKMRGNVGKDTDEGYKRSDGFYTWFPQTDSNGIPKFRPPKSKQIVSSDGTVEDVIVDYGIIVDKSVEPRTVYNFFKTYFARYCMAVGKFNQDAGCAVFTTPDIDFSREWTDEELFAKVGFTEEEIAEVHRIIPPYYDN